MEFRVINTEKKDTLIITSLREVLFAASFKEISLAGVAQ